MSTPVHIRRGPPHDAAQRNTAWCGADLAPPSLALAFASIDNAAHNAYGPGCPFPVCAACADAVAKALTAHAAPTSSPAGR